MVKTALAFTLAVLLILVVAQTTASVARAGAPDSVSAASANELIAAVNALRASNGLPPYTPNTILMQIAQAHATYQAATGQTTHYSADGSRPFQRALAAGYPVAGDLSLGGFFSENIITGFNMNAAEAVEAWTGDAPHLNTMLSPNLQDVGAGVATSGEMTYFTLDAGRASGSPVSYTPPAGVAVGTPGEPIVSQFMMPVVVSTPLDTGEVYHEVQWGQSLWSLAVTYDTTVQQIRSLNNLSGIEVYEGQRLLIGTRGTATPASTVTPTVPAAAAFSTRTPAPASTATGTAQPTAAPAAPVSGGGGLTLAVILGTSLLAAALGTWLSTRRTS